MPLPRSTPEAQAISSSAILDFVRAADAALDSLHSLMIVRHGSVVAEHWWYPYAAQHPHMMFSVSKSFTAIAVGIAIDAGLLSIDDRVTDLLPHDLPAELDANLSALTVRHLLSMTTGHASDTVPLANDSHGADWARAILAQFLEFPPGTRFIYNSGATYLLSAILQRLTGERLLDYLTPRLFEPLGIVGATWESSPQGIDCGGWGLSITTEDLATFGQLLLQRGNWNGRQLVPAAWIDEATSLRVETSTADHEIDGRQGYGYQFWRNRPAGYRADGAFGQMCIVLPEQDAVVVLTSALPVAQRARDLVWEHLLPAFGADVLPPIEPIEPHEPLEPHEPIEPLARPSLALRTVVGLASTPTAQRIAGLRFEFDNGPVTSATLEPGLVTITRDGAIVPLPYAADAWTISPTHRQAVSAAWLSPERFVLRATHFETPFTETFDFSFSGTQATLLITVNVSFAPNLVIMSSRGGSA